MQPSLFKSVRADLAARIARGDLRPGDRLPSERDLTEQFGVTRSVIRQAIAGLVRDGMVISAYPRGYVVLGRRIPWLPRLRPLVDEPWEIEIIDTTERPAGPDDADTFGLIEGDPLARCLFQLRGTHTHTRGRSRSPPTRSTPSTPPPATSSAAPDSSTTTNSNRPHAGASSATTKPSPPDSPPPPNATNSTSPPPSRSSRSPAPPAPPPPRSPNSPSPPAPTASNSTSSSTPDSHRHPATHATGGNARSAAAASTRKRLVAARRC
jgi:DNA-binding transcriptional MocR family regulator